MKERLGECKIYASQFTCIRWELWASFQRPHHGSPQSSLRAMHKVCCFILLIIKPLDFNELKKRYVWYQISCHTLKGLCLDDRNSASRRMACPQYGWTFQTSLYYFLSISLFFFFFLVKVGISCSRIASWYGLRSFSKVAFKNRRICKNGVIIFGKFNMLRK